MARRRHDEAVPITDETREELIPESKPDERAHDVALRPRRFEEYIGQRSLIENLQVFVSAARLP